MPLKSQLYSKNINGPNAGGVGADYYPFRVAEENKLAAQTIVNPFRELRSVYAQWGADALDPTVAYDVATAAAEDNARIIMSSGGSGLTFEEITSNTWAHVISTHFYFNTLLNEHFCVVLYVVSVNDARGNSINGRVDSLY